MDVQDVVAADFLLDLTNSFQERQAFNVADGTADFRNDDIGIVVVADAIDAVLDLIRNVRNDLYRMAQIITAPFFLKNGPIDFTGRDIGVLSEVDIDEAFIVAEIKVRFGTVVGDENFTMLIRLIVPGSMLI